MTGIGTQIKNALGWFLTKLKGNVVNNLTSTSTDLPLSAAKGKDLQDQISTLNTKLTNGFAGGASSGTTNINIDSSNSNYLIIVCDNVDFSICVASRYTGTIKFCLLKNYSGVTYAQLDGRLIGITCNNSYIYSVTKLCHMIN